MNIKLEKKKSKINGFGIFTKNIISKGTEYYKIPLDIIYSKPKPKCARIADGKYVSDKKVLNWINHSCDPNSKLCINRSNPVLAASKDILPNEEITVDYGQTELPEIKMNCTCGSKNCKGYFYKQ